MPSARRPTRLYTRAHARAQPYHQCPAMHAAPGLTLFYPVKRLLKEKFIATIKEMTAKAIISITLAICFLCANGFCLLKENDTTVVLAFQRFNNGGLNDTAINNAIKSYLKRKNALGSMPENPAVSCKKIAELRPRYESGYYTRYREHQKL